MERKSSLPVEYSNFAGVQEQAKQAVNRGKEERYSNPRDKYQSNLALVTQLVDRSFNRT